MFHLDILTAGRHPLRLSFSSLYTAFKYLGSSLRIPLRPSPSNRWTVLAVDVPALLEAHTAANNAPPLRFKSLQVEALFWPEEDDCCGCGARVSCRGSGSCVCFMLNPWGAATVPHALGLATHGSSTRFVACMIKACSMRPSLDGPRLVIFASPGC